MNGTGVPSEGQEKAAGNCRASNSITAPSNAAAPTSPPGRYLEIVMYDVEPRRWKPERVADVELSRIVLTLTRKVYWADVYLHARFQGTDLGIHPPMPLLAHRQDFPLQGKRSSLWSSYGFWLLFDHPCRPSKEPCPTLSGFHCQSPKASH